MKTDINAFSKGVVTRGVIHPNLLDAELQNSYGVHTPGDLLNKMLTAGEFIKLQQKILEISGLDTTIEDDIEEAEN
ncbi:hypothetical protein MsAc7_17620 [Methanolapillus millepedarum]|uniref:XkdN-like protein n=2 Tax=Methanolapillus millepedarum TaxID=3028296 RepID=A0AA96V449_9EURY|nr:hypothetical protein MsAc7_17620 [Methanosarcinaceae archaeon Ac7]